MSWSGEGWIKNFVSNIDSEKRQTKCLYIDAIDSPCLFQLVRIPYHACYTSNNSAPRQCPGNDFHATQGATDNLSIVAAPKSPAATASKTPPWTTRRGTVIKSIRILLLLPPFAPSSTMVFFPCFLLTVSFSRSNVGG